MKILRVIFADLMLIGCIGLILFTGKNLMSTKVSAQTTYTVVPATDRGGFPLPDSSLGTSSIEALYTCAFYSPGLPPASGPVRGNCVDGAMVRIYIKPAPTTDFTDHSSAPVITLNDGFSMRMNDPACPGAAPAYTSFLRLYKATARINGWTEIRAWLPGNKLPEFNNEVTCTGPTNSVTNTTPSTRTIRMYGGNLGSGFQDFSIQLWRSAPDAYLAGDPYNSSAPNTRVLNGYHYNAATNVYTPITTCMSTPSACPKRTGSTGNYLIIYVHGFEDEECHSVADCNFSANKWQFTAISGIGEDFDFDPLTVVDITAIGPTYEQVILGIDTPVLEENVTQELFGHMNGLTPVDGITSAQSFTGWRFKVGPNN